MEVTATRAPSAAMLRAMATELDKVIVVDVEATCWEKGPPPGEEAEIIEVGVCLLDVMTGAREGRRSILVKPERSKVGEHCARLTTRTQADVDRGVSFAAACSELAKYGVGRTWASWGDYDRRTLQGQCNARGVQYPFGRTHLNVKNLFALRRGLHREVGLDEAFEQMDQRLEGKHRCAVDDAWNTAGLLWEIVRWR